MALSSNFVQRFISTWVMIGSFLGLAYLGAVPMLGLVMAMEILMFGELMRLGTSYRKQKLIPGFGLLPWYFLFVGMFFMHGRALRRAAVKTYPSLDGFFSVHSLISFILYTVGFVVFVASLKRRTYMYQFIQFVWTHMVLFCVVVQAAIHATNMMEGMIWYLVPVSLVIANDVWAYVCGRLWGRHMLIKLSPRKTVEGYVGALIITFAWGALFTWILTHWPRMVCPQETLWDTPNCTPGHVFQPKEYRFPAWLASLAAEFGLQRDSITVLPIQVHTAVLSAFAGTIAPFGGFFASGLKRALKIKDFGDIIPGHGGVTDRMDCQMLMGSFTYVYLANVVRPSGGLCSNYGLIAHCVTRLPRSDQLKLFQLLASKLGNVTSIAGSAAALL